MPALRNPRYEVFAREMAIGKYPIAIAYRRAGYANNDNCYKNAYRLMGNDGVKSRIAELQERFAMKAGVTKESITAELEEARELARKLDQPKVMVDASAKKAELHGLVVQKSEAGKPGDFAKTSEERLESIRKSLDILERNVVPASRDTEH